MRSNLVVSITAFAAMCLASTYAMADTTLTESQVRDVCGSKLQSGGGAMGCSKCTSGTCIDYSCGGPGGKGCRGQVVGPPPKAAASAPQGSPKAPTTGLTSTGAMKDNGMTGSKNKLLTDTKLQAGGMKDVSGLNKKLQTDSQIKPLTTTTTTTGAPSLQKR